MFYNSEGGFQSVGHSATGRVLTLDNRARLSGWDVAAGKPERIAAVPFAARWALLKGSKSEAGHVGVLTSFGFHRFDTNAHAELPRFVPGDGRVAEASDDGTLAVVNERGSLRWRLWNLETGEALSDHFDLAGESADKFRYHPLLAPDNRTFVVSAATDGRLLLWERESPKARVLQRSRAGHHYPLLAFAPSGQFLAAAQVKRHGAVTVWNLPTGEPRWSVPQEVFVWAVAVHPSGNLLAVATVGGAAGRVVRFLDATTGREITRFTWNAGRIRCLSFSPDGLTCAAGCSDRRLVVWDVDY